MSEIRVDTISEKTSGSGTTVSNLKNPNQPFRNLITNGDMQVHQRGGSTQITTSDGMAVDRFKVSTRVTSYDATWSQSTTVPSGQGFTTSLKCDVNGTASPTGSANYLLGQRFEGQYLQHLQFGTSSAESLTIQFWVRSSKTGAYCFQARSLDDVKSCIVEYTISSADTWEKKTITLSGNTANDFDNDNAASLEFCWHLSVGTDDDNETASSSWGVGSNSFVTTSNQVNLFDSATAEWYITGIQVEVGTTATDFEFLPFDVQLRRCQRYFQTLEMASNSMILGNATASTNTHLNFQHPDGKMRAAPTVTLPTAGNSSNTTAFLTAPGAYPSTIGSHAASVITEHLVRVDGTIYSANFIAGYASLFYSNGTNTFKMDAEL